MKKPKGFWNGEPASYEVYTVEVIDSEFPAYWARCFIGTQRQAVKVAYPDNEHCFYIDNEDGLGLFKVTTGGSPSDGHRSLNCKEIKLITDVSLYKRLNLEKYREIEKVSDEYLEKTNPELFLKIQKMKEAFPEVLKKSIFKGRAIGSSINLSGEKCPKCGCQIKDPFAGSTIIHNVEKCNS